MQKINVHVAQFLAATAVFLAMPVVHADTQPPASAVNAIGGENAVNLTAKITKIFPDTNSIAVQGPKGHTVVIDVDPATANVHKLKVGDDVSVAYREALLMSADKVDPKGARGRVSAEATLPASNGVVVKTRTVQVVATIQALDIKTREVALAGPEYTASMTVSPDVDLGKLKVGDSIAATYASAMAISVTRNGAVVK
jgi:Cu/Ag efflux protein CusF